MSAAPARTPLACGALGSYNPDVVRRIGAAMPSPVELRHADDRSALMLDRPPVKWGRPHRARGLAWSEQPRPPSRIRATGWRDVARHVAAAGLVIDGKRRFVHSSVSGVASVYYLAHRKAVYFASRIDPLVNAVPVPLTADWRAWSSILSLRYPVGRRTPFEEVRRLPPFSVLTGGPDGPELQRTRWPWKEVEPTLDLEAGADAVVEAMREAVAPLADEPVTCPLSGGLDSRVLICLLAEGGVDRLRAITANADRGWDRDEVAASSVASALGVHHQLVSGSSPDYWAEVRERALRCDFQLADEPWSMPLARRLRECGGPAPDGLALDVLAQPGKRFFTEDMTRPDGTDRVARRLWKRLAARGGLGDARPDTLDPRLARAVAGRARAEFLRVTNSFRGHPSEPALAFYSTRTLRGIALTPHSVLGADAHVWTPFSEDAVARACLAIGAPEKFGSKLYAEIFNRLNPAVGALPSTRRGRDLPATRTPARHLSPQALDGYRQVLLSGPLTPYLGRALRRRISSGDLGPALAARPSRSVVQAAVLFHLWHERYRARMSGADPAVMLGTQA